MRKNELDADRWDTNDCVAVADNQLRRVQVASAANNGKTHLPPGLAIVCTKEEVKNETMFLMPRPGLPTARSWFRLWQKEQGQSLIEIALMIPIFTILVCYAVDFGFFFLVATSLNSAARNALEYSIQGTSSPAQAAEPSAALVSNLAIASIGLSGASTANVSIQVCSSAVGINSSNNTTQCTTPSSGAGAVTGTPDVDPESPKFQLNRVDVVYTITPPVPMPVSIFPLRTFHRMVEMRAMQ